MNVKNHFLKLALMLVTVVMLAGCDQAKEAAEEAGAEAQNAAGEAMEKGKEMASDLSEKAMDFLKPMKEKISSLESMVDTPDELKAEVEGMLSSLEEKAEGLKLPEAVTGMLASVKEQLVALKDYLATETSPEKIREHINNVKEAFSEFKL